MFYLFKPIIIGFINFFTRCTINELVGNTQRQEVNHCNFITVNS